jgi:hypothetical protein
MQALRKTHQEVLQGLVVGDDAIVYHHKLVLCIRDLRVAVCCRRNSMRGPTRVRDASMIVQRLVQVDSLLHCLLIGQFDQCIHLARGLDDHWRADNAGTGMLEHYRRFAAVGVGNPITNGAILRKASAIQRLHRVTIEGDPSRVVPSVLKTAQTREQILQNCASVTRHPIVVVSKYPAHKVQAA